MICPKCKIEYQEGYTKCSDCGADLVRKEPDKNKGCITINGISMIKYGLGLVFFILFELIGVIIAYEFQYLEKIRIMRVEGGIIGLIHPIIWVLFIIQLIISMGMIFLGKSCRNPN